jgi:hypothetical protein
VTLPADLIWASLITITGLAALRSRRTRREPVTTTSSIASSLCAIAGGATEIDRATSAVARKTQFAVWHVVLRIERKFLLNISNFLPLMRKRRFATPASGCLSVLMNC